jgi:hypothetical protein
MKKIIALLLLLSSPTWAARACVKVIEDIDGHTDPPNAAIVRWDLKVSYQGTDVPGLTQKGFVSIVVSTSTTALQIQSAIVAAVQADATSRGFTVPTGATLMPTFSFL